MVTGEATWNVNGNHWSCGQNRNRIPTFIFATLQRMASKKIILQRGLGPGLPLWGMPAPIAGSLCTRLFLLSIRTERRKAMTGKQWHARGASTCQSASISQASVNTALLTKQPYTSLIGFPMKHHFFRFAFQVRVKPSQQWMDQSTGLPLSMVIINAKSCSQAHAMRSWQQTVSI